MKIFIFLFTFVLISSPLAHGGNEGRGTEDAVLIGLALKMRMGPTELAAFEQRKALLRNTILSPQWRDRVYSFVEQVGAARLSQSVPSSDRFIYIKMQTGGLLNDIRQTPFEVLDTCKDVKGETRSAATITHPLAPICFDTDRIALLELVTGLSGYAPHFDLLFGITMHEFARHYDEDDNHTFLLAMAAEASQQFVVSDRSCPTTSNICPSGRGDYTYGIDLSISPAIQVKMDVKQWVSSTLKKGKLKWKIGQCADYNFLDVPQLSATKPKEDYFSQKMVVNPENGLTQSQFDFPKEESNSLRINIVNRVNATYPEKYEAMKNAHNAALERYNNVPAGTSVGQMEMLDNLLRFTMPPSFQYPCGDNIQRITLIDSAGQPVVDDGHDGATNASIPLKFIPWTRPMGFTPVK